MSKKTKFINANRRGFMQKSAVAGTVAATGATVSTGANATEVINSDKSQTSHAGYQLTDRVREYYRKARF